MGDETGISDFALDAVESALLLDCTATTPRGSSTPGRSAPTDGRKKTFPQIQEGGLLLLV